MTDGSHVQADRLLAVLEPLPYPRRMRELADRAAGLDRAGARALLAALDARGPYERGLAVVVAAVTRDGDWLGERLGDPDAFVRGHVRRVATPSVVPDEAFAAALDDAPAVVRRDVLTAIVTGGRTALADRLVDGVREDWGDEEAARLLPGCGPETVRRLLPELFHAVRGWTGLAKRHAEALADAVGSELAVLPGGLRDAWWGRYLPAVRVLADAVPARVVGLLDACAPGLLTYAYDDIAATLAAGDPEGIARLLVSGRCEGLRPLVLFRSAAVRHVVRRAPEDLVAALGRSAVDQSGELAALIAALPPGRRTAFHDAAVAGRSQAKYRADTAILDALPREGAAREARRVVEHCQGRAGAGPRLLAATSYLPVGEAREPLLAATREPSADDRAEAWSLLIRNAARSGDPAAVTTVVTDMARLRNEQDPVRAEALEALATVPPHLFAPAAAPHLARIATDTAEAPDCSPGSRRSLIVLALGVLREQATGRVAGTAGGPSAVPAAGPGTGPSPDPALRDWALGTLVRLCEKTGGVDLGRLDHVLARGQERLVVEALRPWAEAGADKADFSLVLALVRALGGRAGESAELQELLWRAIREGGGSTARTAVALWLEPVAERDVRVERLLAHDLSAAVLPAVVHTLTTRRTDLLGPLVDDTPPYGRFLTPGTRWTVPVGPDARRWTGGQQLAAVRQWERVLAGAALPEHSRAAALHALALLPDGAGAVRARTGDPSVVLAEAALAALACTVRPGDALPELLGHAGDDRARVAVFAARGAALHVAPSRLEPLLRGLIDPVGAKVTSRKEAVRMVAGRLPRRAATALVVEAYELPGQHRDVRTACVAAAARLFADPRAERLLTGAAAGDTAQRRAVLRVGPAELPVPLRPRYARLVEEVARTDDAELAAEAYQALAAWMPWFPHAAELLAAAVADLDVRDGWRAAADGLASTASALPVARAAFESALDALVALDAAAVGGPTDAGTERDRPALKRIAYQVGALSKVGTARAAARPVRTAAVERLARYEATAGRAALLWAEALDLAGGPDELHAALVRLARLHDGRPMQLARSVNELGRRLCGRQREGDAESLHAAARRLAATGDHAEGVLAVVLAAAGGQRTDWSDPWRMLLRELRGHADPEVRDEARQCTTAYG